MYNSSRMPSPKPIKIKLEDHVWWEYAHSDVKELMKQSINLLEKAPKWKNRYHDYSFVVFPAAKAYEGFLKNLFRDLGFITNEDYYGKHFRIGRALNPSLEPRFRESESVYDRIAQFCGGRELPDKLWHAWRQGRNLLFHWFPDQLNVVTYKEASECVNLIIDAMDFAFKECKLK